MGVLTPMRDDTLSDQRRALGDYRLALGLELKARRGAARYSLHELSSQVEIPVETLRGYEKGAFQPQLMRLARIGRTYGVSALEILISTAEYIYRAHGEPIPDATIIPVQAIASRAVILYCGVIPMQLRLMESPPE